MSILNISYTLDQVDMVAMQCAIFIQDVSVVTLTGTLGAGKTTFVSALLKQWGVRIPIVSPTFTYVNEYRLSNGKTVYHFDLYRLETQEAFERAGFGDYLYQENSLCIIEWPEIIMPLLTKSVCGISIEFLELRARRLMVNIKQ